MGSPFYWELYGARCRLELFSFLKKAMVDKKRNYVLEYKNYQGKPEQIARRDSRNKARAAMIKAGKAKKGDGMDVEHKNGNPLDDRLSNYKLGTKRDNRSYPRTKTAGKVNPRS